jgi:hypothetical protein
MTLPEQAPDQQESRPRRQPDCESPADGVSAVGLLALRNDLAVALLALEALSLDATLGAEQRRLVDVGLARQLRAVERLAVRSGRQVAHPQI